MFYFRKQIKELLFLFRKKYMKITRKKTKTKENRRQASVYSI